MANNSRVVDTILKYVVDRASIQQAVNSAKAVDTALHGNTNELKQLGPAASNAVSRIKSEFKTADREVENSIRTLNRYEQELKELDNITVRPKVAVQGGARRGDGVTNIAGDFGSFFSATGGLEGLAGSESLQQLGQLGDVIEAVGRLGVIGGVAAAGVALVNVALGDLEEQARKTAERQKEVFEANASAAELIAQGGTTEDVQGVVLARNQEREAIQAQLAEYNEILATYEATKNTQSGLMDALEAAQEVTRRTGGTVDGLKERIEELETELGATDIVTREFLDLLGSEQIIRNDAAAENERLAEQEAEINEEAARIHEEVAEAKRQYNEALREELALNIEAALRGVAGGIGQLFENADTYHAQLDEIAEAQQELNDVYAEGAQKVADLTAASQVRQNQILEDAYVRAEELTEEHGIEVARAQEDLNRELDRIQRRADMEHLNAVGERDALAAFLSEQRAVAEQEEAEDNADVEARRREQDYQRSLRQLAEATDRRLRAERDALQRSLELAERAWRAELAMRQEALQAEQSMLSQFVQGVQQSEVSVAAVTTQFTNFMGAQVGYVQGLLNTIGNAAQEEVGSIGDLIGSTDPGVIQPTEFASGGRFGAYQVMSLAEYGHPEAVMFDRPGTVANAQQTQAMLNGASGGSTINIVMDGKSIRATARAEAHVAIDEFFDRVGVD